MDNWFKSKWFVRGVALAFSILLYMFVNIEVSTQTDSRFIPIGNDELQTINDVPVDIRIDSDRFVVSGVPEFVSLSLEGMNSVLTPTVKQRNFDVFVDLEDIGEGTHTVDIQHDRIPSELSVYIEPKTIEVTIEERSSKEFSVTVDFINEDKLPGGYELGASEVKPKTITITSSKSVIEQIAIVKAYIDVAGLTESINNREVPVNVYDAQGNRLNVSIVPENVIISVLVDNPSKVVPLKISTTGTLPEGFKLTSISTQSDEVKVFAPANALKEINEVSTKEVDLSKVKESGTMDVELALPDGATASDGKVKVAIEIEQTKVIDEIPYIVESSDEIDIAYEKPENPTMKVTAVGNERDIKKLKTDEIHLSIDVKDLEEGKHVVPVSIEGPENVKLSAEFKEVTIRITK